MSGPSILALQCTRGRASRLQKQNAVQAWKIKGKFQNKRWAGFKKGRLFSEATYDSTAHFVSRSSGIMFQRLLCRGWSFRTFRVSLPVWLAQNSLILAAWACAFSSICVAAGRPGSLISRCRLGSRQSGTLVAGQGSRPNVWEKSILATVVRPF